MLFAVVAPPAYCLLLFHFSLQSGCKHKHRYFVKHVLELITTKKGFDVAINFAPFIFLFLHYFFFYTANIHLNININKHLPSFILTLWLNVYMLLLISCLMRGVFSLHSLCYIIGAKLRVNNLLKSIY